MRKKLLSPVVLRRLQNLEAAEGARIVAEVEVGGTPPPIVSWFKDGSLITGGGASGLQFRDDGCRHLLIIDKTKVCIIDVTDSKVLQIKSFLYKVEHSGVYGIEAANDAGRAHCQATFRFCPTSQREVASESAISKLGPESRALKTLAAHRHSDRRLPDLLPFPFLADGSRPQPPRKRNYGKVPKPSKFTQGEMYYSDYESDFEGRILSKWKPYESDTEAMQPLYR